MISVCYAQGMVVLKLVRYLIVACLCIALALCALFAVFQTKWAKEQIRTWAIHALKERGIDVDIGEIHGQFPFTWVIDHAGCEGLELTEIKLRFAALPLLRGTIGINYLHIEKAAVILDETPLPSLEELREALPYVPWNLKINHLTIDQCIIRHPSCALATSLQAKVFLQRYLRGFGGECTLTSLDQTPSSITLRSSGSHTRNQFEADLHARLYQSPSSLDLSGSLSGSWDAFEGLLLGEKVQSHPLEGEMKALLWQAEVPEMTLLNGNWKLLGTFALPSLNTFVVHKCKLESETLSLKGQGLLAFPLIESEAILSFSLPDLSFNGHLPLRGGIDGKLLYRDRDLKGSLALQDLSIHSFNAKSGEAVIKAHIGEIATSGQFQLCTEGKIPLENRFAFSYSPVTAKVEDFLLRLPSGKIEGDLAYAMQGGLLDGVVRLEIAHLDHLESLFQDKTIDGSLAAECMLSSRREEQAMHCTLRGTNLRFQEYLADSLYLSTEKIGREGYLNVLGEKLYFPNMMVDRLVFGTRSGEIHYPFYLSAEGKIESPFTCVAKGFLENDEELLSLELVELKGTLAEVPFALDYPALLEWGAQFCNLSPVDFSIGAGHLFTTFEMNPVRTTSKWQLTHFPLEILSCVYPRFTLKGYTSINGYLEASPDYCEGTCNAVLEEAGVLHFGKQEPFRAKGSLQAHLDHNRLQIHSSLEAIDGQFLDSTASLPIDYQTFPLQITLSKEEPISAELIAEGKLEDLFDFVNLGTNHATGLVSCRLFLSKTLSHPALLGKLDWENGTYDNYFTGTSLREIHAALEAQNDTLHLLSLSASDHDKGTLSGTGQISLLPGAHFPYAFEAELDHLHTLGFDMIDCDFTGPLYFTGTTESALAEGNLLIDEAIIHLDESLPYEVPSLPVTYIHPPPHLQSSALTSIPEFRFHIDVELTADDKVYAQGRGLNAELQGHLHLTGTDRNIAANGSLKLIKGEYLFFGKIFKLSEGEITFSDKPAGAYLNLQGTLTLSDVMITAMLRGPLKKPQLQFQSNPHLPTSSILARILFNKDIADISHPEAIQLANALVSLSGGAGPDVLEAIRKSIGIDRLTIVSASPGSDQIALQIGKYLTRGVLITLSQSATSSQVIVEVELPHGFVFQAETQEDEEGKFTLKWTKSY
ncbi:MAG: translocation/assembly module TamB [Verrucomicrobia bacterium]|nr:translocation/assembly module TamB [Verrucomicrobiota bacterium]